MNLLHRFEHWGDTHHPKYLDIIRIVLGIFLFIKGITFLQNSGSLAGMMSLRVPFSSFFIMMLSHYVAFAHLLGGILLVVGVFTRFACIIQIPVLIGAIIFVNSAADVVKPYSSEMFLSVLVLLLLIYFLIVGNGPWALKLGSGEKGDQ